MKKKLIALIIMMIAVCWTASAMAFTAVAPATIVEGMSFWWDETGPETDFMEFSVEFYDDGSGMAWAFFGDYQLDIMYGANGRAKEMLMYTPPINDRKDFLAISYNTKGDIVGADYWTNYHDEEKSWDVYYNWRFDEQAWYDLKGNVVTGIQAFKAADYVMKITFVDGDSEEPTVPPVEFSPTLDNAYGKLAIVDANGNLVDYTGFEKFEGGSFYFEHGIIRDDMDGLTMIDGTWYNMTTGQVNTSEGFVFFEGGTFYVKNGTLDKTQDGLIQYDGEWFVFSNGQFQPQVYGAWPDHRSGKFVYIWAGQFYPITDLVSYDGEIFYFINGYLATDFVGTVYDFNGTPFNVVYGQVY